MELNEAYLIVEKPHITQAQYLNLEKSKDLLNNVQRLREVLSFINPLTYKGISRTPLEAFPISDVAKLRTSGYFNVDINTEAQLKILELIDNYTENDYLNSTMLANLADAIEVYNLLDENKRDDYEIIKTIRHSTSRTNSTLGYDIGYWGSDHFSIICDCAIWPMWHPPSWDDLAELAQYLKPLNEYQLFDDISQANAFRQWYRTKDWAETEFNEDEFCIIQIDKCDYQ